MIKSSLSLYLSLARAEGSSKERMKPDPGDEAGCGQLVSLKQASVTT